MHEKPVMSLVTETRPPRMCSVCGTASYSQFGIHPQCAQEQADIERVNLFKLAREADPPKIKVARPDLLQRWQKLCPKCHTRLHVRKLACGCGHRFLAGGE